MKIPLVLWGGTDINSSLYNKPRSKYAQNPDVVRDMKEEHYIRLAVKKEQPIIGVCRGAQLLCAINGGTLYQHSVPKTQNHSILTLDGILFDNVRAGHHQVMNPSGKFIVYGWNPSHVKIWHDDEHTEEIKNTAEVVWWPETKSLGIQPHPEWSTPDDPFVIWLNDLIKRLGIDYVF